MPASLVLGGYDQSRVGTELRMPISEDEDRPLSIALQKVTARGTLNGTVTLSDDSESIVIPIDSSVSDLWLPHSWCDRIATAFELQYNFETNRYILSKETLARLRQLSPTLTFTIGSRGAESRTIDIQIPYAAVDLQASTPVFANTVDYFPIRRAANQSQYILGRAFLQEVYIGVDYERNYFNVSQVIFSDPMPEPNIVAIAPTNSPASNNTRGDISSPPIILRKISAGAVSGIVIGTLVVSALLVWFLWMLARKQKHKKGDTRANIAEDTEEELLQRQEISSNEVSEMHGNQDHIELEGQGMPNGGISEMHEHHGRVELEERVLGVREILGSRPPIHEMPGKPVPVHMLGST